MTDAQIAALLDDLAQRPLDEHPAALETVYSAIDEELRRLREQLPGAPRDGG